MKKAVSFFVAAVLLLTLCSCGKHENIKTNGGVSGGIVKEESESTSNETTADFYEEISETTAYETTAYDFEETSDISSSSQTVNVEFRLVFTGDWDLIADDSYIERCENLFYEIYPRLYARFAFENDPKTVTFKADRDYDGEAYTSGTLICVGVDYANKNPDDVGFLAHELIHIAQQYGDNLNYGGDAWWTETMANYGRFRYFNWSSAERVVIYSADDNSLREWKYEPYGNSQWFFSYIDEKYPTTKKLNGSTQYGLIDSVNRLIKNHSGTQLNDDPYDSSTEINKAVQSITGYDCFESLRLKYIQELENGTWVFEGFKNYSDNFITENLPNVSHPEYPQITSPVHTNKTAVAEEPYTNGINLCENAKIYDCSGQVNLNEKAELLIDGNSSTKWCSTPSTVDNPIYNLDTTQQWIIIDLGERKSFNTYTIYNTRTMEAFGNMTEWELLVSDDAKNWQSADYQPYCNQDKASFTIGDTVARYVMLRVYNADDNNIGTIRLYEFMLFNK